MGNFHIGQVVIVTCPDSLVHGALTTITALDVPSFDWDDGPYVGHRVDIEEQTDWGETHCVFEPHELIPFDDRSAGIDANKTVSWSDCEWMPDHLRERA